MNFQNGVNVSLKLFIYRKSWGNLQLLPITTMRALAAQAACATSRLAETTPFLP